MFPAQYEKQDRTQQVYMQGLKCNISDLYKTKISRLGYEAWHYQSQDKKQKN